MVLCDTLLATVYNTTLSVYMDTLQHLCYYTTLYFSLLCCSEAVYLSKHKHTYGMRYATCYPQVRVSTPC